MTFFSLRSIHNHVTYCPNIAINSTYLFSNEFSRKCVSIVSDIVSIQCVHEIVDNETTTAQCFVGQSVNLELLCVSLLLLKSQLYGFISPQWVRGFTHMPSGYARIGCAICVPPYRSAIWRIVRTWNWKWLVMWTIKWHKIGFDLSLFSHSIAL